jgi:branched-chain amino acid transport system ATP-binding protein
MILKMENVAAGYGTSTVIDGVSLDIRQGGRLALLGRNGTGKTTLIRTVMGLTNLHAGRIFWNGRDISRIETSVRASLGLGWVPQERRVFPNLTVEENLTFAARPGDWTLVQVYRLLPRLQERRSNLGWQLSGGEQQLLAIGRALMLNPRLLLLDEPLEGLAPVMAELVLATLHDIARSGVALVIVEQHAADAMEMADKAIIMDRGRIVVRDDSAALINDPDRLEAFIGVGLAQVHGALSSCW